MNSRNVTAIQVLVFLLLTCVPLATAEDEEERPILTEEQFNLESEILRASGQDTIRFACATYLRESTLVISNISDMCIVFEPGSIQFNPQYYLQSS